ncbi:MAG: Omp28-related outer membrane protein [Moheibacter sp.]
MKQFFTKFLLVGFAPLALYGQTIVSTTPENRKAILEEFTGIHCVYCPQGHAIAEQIMEDNPGNAFAINIHQGGYAVPSAGQPDFRTPFGNAIAGQTGLTGYPSGTVNRHNFPGLEMGNSGTTAMGRGQWVTAANQIMALPSYLNMAVEATIDVSTREITVHVESYYTGDSSESTNLLNVALLQNNTKGPQTGGNAGNNYNHMRRLVHMITGQWGDEVSTTTSGSFVDRTYTYTIPADYNDIPADISEMEVIVFMTETHQEIVSGNRAIPTYTGVSNANDLAVNSIEEIDDQCLDMIAPVIEIQNRGQDNITSATIEYSINGTTHTYNWSGNLSTYQKETVELPEASYTLQDINTVEITLSTDDDSSNNSVTTTFDTAVETTNVIRLRITTDAYGDEVGWNITDSSGAIIEQGGPYGNNQQYTIDIVLPSQDCYTFNLMDAYGDGGGGVILRDSNNAVIYGSSGNYGSGASASFQVGTLGVDDLDASMVSIYPNPSNGIINITTKSVNSSIEVFDVTGRKVYSTASDSTLSTIDLSTYGKGVFVIKVSDGKQVETKKVIIK